MLLGYKFIDLVSGFEGFCTAVCERIEGNVDLELTPYKYSSPNTESKWFPKSRLAQIEGQVEVAAVFGHVEGGDPALVELSLRAADLELVDETLLRSLQDELGFSPDKLGQLRLAGALLKLGFGRDRDPETGKWVYVRSSRSAAGPQ